MAKFSFPSTQRLKSRKTIALLFQKGSQTFNVYPVRMVWTSVENALSPIQATFSVSKKSFKQANQRNLLKRRMREAFRLSKHKLFCALEQSSEEQQPEQQSIKQFALILIYNGKEILPYTQIERAINIGIKKWTKIQEETTAEI